MISIQKLFLNNNLDFENFFSKNSSLFYQLATNQWGDGLKTIHPQRLQQFFFSRYQLLKHLESLHFNFKLTDLNLDSQFNLKVLKDPISLSHSADCCLSLIGQGKLTVGVDIEFIHRNVNEKSVKFWKNENDCLELKPLELWCAKEACFKAIFKLRPIQSLKEITITHPAKASFQDINLPLSWLFEDELMICHCSL